MLDAVVIGAGPAGLACALRLAERGFAVAVVEREDRPNRGKLCAGYVPLCVFERYGIPSSLGEYPVRGALLVSRAGEWELDLGRTVGYNVDRERFAEHLAARVEKEGGELLLGTAALRVVKEGGAVAVYCSGGAVVKARVAVAADGVYSRIAASVRGRLSRRDLGVTIQVRASGVPASGLNTVLLGSEYSPFGYAWAFPKRGHVDVGVGALASRTRGPELRKYLSKALERCGYKPLGQPRYAPVPLTGPVYAVARGRLLIAGDAAGHVSPLIGEGIRFAMEAGTLAAEAAAEHLAGRASVAQMCRAYLAGLKRAFYPRFRLEKLIVRLFERRTLTSGKLLSKPGAREAIAQLYLDAAPLSRIILRALAAYLKP